MEKLLLAQFDLHHRLYNNVLDGFTDEKTNQRLHGDTNMNHVKYLAGHILNSQYGIALLANASSIEPKWNDLFAGAGRSEPKDNFDYPSIDTIKAKWNAIFRPIRSAIDDIASELLDQKPPMSFE